jgi:hypothetical protein
MLRTWGWFGPNDPVGLDNVRHVRAAGLRVAADNEGPSG